MQAGSLRDIWSDEQVLDWGVAVVAVLTAIVGVVVVWRKGLGSEERLPLRLGLAIALSLLAFATTLPTSPSPPFHLGQKLGWGLLVGASLSCVAATLASAQQRLLAGFISLLPATLAIWLFKHNPFPILFGLTIGIVLVWFLTGKLMQPLAISQFALIAAIGLARWHEQPVGISKHLWQALPLCLAVAGWIAVGSKQGWQRYWQRPVTVFPSLTVASLLLLIGSFIMFRFSGDHRLIIVSGLSCGSVLLFVLMRETAFREASPLLWIGLFAISFAVIPITREHSITLARGYGVALAALALAWLAQILDEQGLWQGAAMLIAFAFFRLFAETYPLRVPRADLYTHYTFVGFLFGALVPVLLTQWHERQQSIIRSLTVGFYGAAIPVLFGSLWGVKAVVGYLGGGIASALLSSVTAVSSSLFAGFATALPLTVLVDPISDWKRQERVWVLLGAVAILAVALLVDWLFHRTKRRV